MNALNMFKDLLLTHGNVNVDDEFINCIIEKIGDVLTDDETEFLEELGEKLVYAKVEEEFVDRYPEVTSEDLNKLFKHYIWDNSSDWANEMYSVTDGIMSNLNMLESDALKQFIKTLNEKDEQDGRFRDVRTNGES